jgi:hypothetical protein
MLKEKSMPSERHHHFWQRALRFVLLVVGMACVGGGLRAEEAPALPDREQFHLFLLAGQSNMAGRGIVEKQDRVPHPRVLTLTKSNTWTPAVDPIHFDKSAAGVCLGRTFGIEIAEADPSITIGLIPCAVGGSPISSWEPGGYHDQTKSHPYDDAMERVRFARKTGMLRGILWHQGESDSNAKKAPLYEEKLHALIERFRRDLEAPEVPFIVGQLGIFEERPWNEWRQQVDAAHAALPGKIPFTAFVPSNGLTPNADLIHFDNASLREFGGRYAKAYLQLMSHGPQATGN